MNRRIITIDGPAASGKGTIAKQVAAHFGLPFLDTGKLYRAVGRHALERNLALDHTDEVAELVRFARQIDPKTLSDPKLATDEVGNMASKVSVISEIRTALLGFQRDFAHLPEGAVLDGRDTRAKEIESQICERSEMNALRHSSTLSALCSAWHMMCHLLP